MLAARGRFLHEWRARRSRRSHARAASTCRHGTRDFFGEVGLLEKTLRNATVTATTPVRLITLTGWDLKRVERAAPEALERVRSVLEARRPASG